MEDSEPLELDWLLKCNLEELIASVRPMSAKNCEQIVRAILDRIGGPTFEQLLARIVETMVPRDGRGPPTNSDFILQFVICFRKYRRKMMFWADSYVLLCECASYGSKRTAISPRIEQNIFPLLQSVMTHIQITHPKKFAAMIQVSQAFAAA